MFNHIRFDVQIERTVSAEGLRWPVGEEVETDSGLGCNRDYCDLRGVSWTDAQETRAFELRVIRQIESGVELEEDDEHASIEEALESTDETGLLMGVDIGVASAVAALSAARCIPVTSCNGGAWGVPHHEVHPLVVFCAKPQHLELLVQAAEKADVGLVSNAGFLVVYADDIRKMPVFALELIAMRAAFRQLRFRTSANRKAGGDTSSVRQLRLFD